ncbi:MAG TPA: extracellular solute-binding protein, partial [Spirochaetia bacterium]|nr:extracellular solute-binding protein [Spirochaetia bacterium]
MKRSILFMLAGLVLSIPLFAGGTQESQAATKSAVTLRIAAKDFTTDDPNNVTLLENITKAFSAKVGQQVNLTLVNVPSASYAQKLNLMLMSGDVPDIIYFQGGDEQISSQGMLVDLRPYIQKSAVMQKALLWFNKTRMENYPYLIWLAPPRIQVPLMRSDWFQQIGGKMPVTLDDYYQILKSFSTTAFSNSQSPHYGITDTGNTARMDSMFDSAFGLTTTWVKDASGQWVYSRVTQNEKDELAFYQKLYAEHILDPDYITTKWDTMEDKLYTGKVGMVVGTAGTVVDIYESKLAKANPNEKVGLVVGPPAKGKAQSYTIDVSKESRGWAISTASKNKDLAWQLLDFMASDQGQTIDRLGIEGIHHVTSNGKITLTPKFADWYPRFFEVVNWKS